MIHLEQPIFLQTAVVGTGAAGYSAAIRLSELGVSPIAVFTEGILTGTSRNTGSDKQTYYKLSLAGNHPDCVSEMARDLFNGGCVDGDNALCEAALSARCFLRLCELGVPFPTDEYGQYVGYKTDHDPAARATSAGPLTSKLMTEALEQEAARREIAIYDHMTVIRILKAADGTVCGMLALDTSSEPLSEKAVLIPIICRNIIWATGGPAGIYADTVYPLGHTGTTSVPLVAGATAQNLTEWQYGLASIAPRWNVSGTYMQVLPRLISIDSNGEEREFLLDAFNTVKDSLSALFLKGYQWPFDCRKLGGSSISSWIDLLVYRETVQYGRRVFLDFTHNPALLTDLPYEKLSEEARDYLSRAGACFGRPIDRLAVMNQPAIELYASKGVDLYSEKLEIALCAQHNNGGISVDSHWQSTIPGLFVCGEAAGTHGITRPGGSALNAGQVGALRAAQYIALERNQPCETVYALSVAHDAVPSVQAMLFPSQNEAVTQAADVLSAARVRMSRAGAALRNELAIQHALAETERDLCAFPSYSGSLLQRFRLWDTLTTQKFYLTAMLDYIVRGGVSRGSALVAGVADEQNDAFCEVIRLRYRTPNPQHDSRDCIQTITQLSDGNTVLSWRPVRPLSLPDAPFETVWRAFRERII